jgi:hypothetical protein
VSTFFTKRNDVPDIGCDAAAYQYIKTVRPKVYVFPRLKLGKTGPCPEHNKRAKNEWDRRNLERTMAGKLSRYYRVPGDNMAVVPQEEEMVWIRPALMREGED